MAITGSIGLEYDAAIELINNASVANGWGITAVEGSIGQTSIQFKDSNGNKFAATCDEGNGGQPNYPGSTVYFDNGNSVARYYKNTNTGASRYDVYICSHGFIISIYASGYTTQRANLLITVNDDGTIKTVFTAASGDAMTTCKCVGFSENSYQSCSYTANSANSTSLTNFVSKGSIGADSSCQYAYFMPLYQYSTAGIITMNGKNYITNGYWCIQDE